MQLLLLKPEGLNKHVPRKSIDNIPPAHQVAHVQHQLLNAFCYTGNHGLGHTSFHIQHFKHQPAGLIGLHGKVAAAIYQVWL